MRPGLEPALDPRLSLALDLYDSCRLAADIGTDHAHLPAALLMRGRCQHMILTDLSPHALENARKEITRLTLESRAELRLGEGLTPLNEPCDMISVTGMGGRTIRSILMNGASRLCGASLILSAHTDLPMVRRTVMDIGYYLDREEPCFSGGRYYLVFRARPGIKVMSDREVRLGSLLYSSGSPVLIPFLNRMHSIIASQLSGLRSAQRTNQAKIAMLSSDLEYLEHMIHITSLRRK